MDLSALPLATALVAGSAHALEPDHVAAVTAFVSRRPHPVRAMGFGVRWALGHSLALLLAGGVLVALDLRFSESIARSLEAGVGAMLCVLGAWSLGGALHGTTWVGMAHGLAGTTGFLALLPAVLLGSPWAAGGYVVVFGLGTVLAMGAYAFAAGVLLHRADVRAPRLGRRLRVATALATLAIGAVWVYGALVG